MTLLKQILTNHIFLNPQKIRPRTISSRYHDLIRLLRIKHWVKNRFILSPVVFLEQLLPVDPLEKRFCINTKKFKYLNDLSHDTINLIKKITIGFLPFRKFAYLIRSKHKICL